MSSEITVQKFIIGPIQTNCYLVYDKTTRECVVIDPAAPEQALKDHIRKEGLTVKCVVNTHGHYDHIMGDSFLKVPVYIHELDADCLVDPKKSLGGVFHRFMTPPDTIIKLKDGDTIKLGGGELLVIHTPGHTVGGISLLIGKHLFSGDTLFHEGVGRTDLSGGSQTALLHSICDKLFKLPDDTKVYPGHGPGTTIRHEKDNNPFI